VPCRAQGMRRLLKVMLSYLISTRVLIHLKTMITTIVPPHIKQQVQEVEDQISVNELEMKYIKNYLLIAIQVKRKKYSSRDVEHKFGCSIRTMQRIWERVEVCKAANIQVDVGSKMIKNNGNKRMQAELSALTTIPLNERSTIRSAAQQLGINKSTFHKLFKEGKVHRHSNTLKPLLREDNKIDRLR
jgi:hypothetical protein